MPLRAICCSNKAVQLKVWEAINVICVNVYFLWIEHSLSKLGNKNSCWLSYQVSYGNKITRKTIVVFHFLTAFFFLNSFSPAHANIYIYWLFLSKWHCDSQGLQTLSHCDLMPVILGRKRTRSTERIRALELERDMALLSLTLMLTSRVSPLSKLKSLDFFVPEITKTYCKTKRISVKIMFFNQIK